MSPLSTNAFLRTAVVAIPILILALVLGSQIGSGSWLLPIVLAGGCVLFALYLLFFRAVTVDTLVLGVLIFGYIVGSRGFAQLHLGQATAIYVGELGLSICLALLAARFAVQRKRLVPRTALAWAIVAFLVLGGIRLSLDTFFQPSFVSPMAAIRDAATVYYAIFFFVTFRLGENALARRILERCILIACVALLPVAAIYIFEVNDIFNRLTIRGYPLISHKGDLATTYLAFASFYFFLRPARGSSRMWLRTLALVFFAGMIIWTARAALLGFGCALSLLFIARRPQIAFYQAGAAIALLIVLGLLQLANLKHDNSYLARILDRVESITDVSGTHAYHGEAGESSAQNNRFRLVWWESVIKDTMDNGPIFGLGFGYDLAKKFLLSYETPMNVFEFDARSPHSVWVTVFGRMGFLGLISFTSIVLFILRDAIRAARRVAQRKAEPWILAHWCAALIILGSASFGVVLEGPMGGILFWSFLGLASSQLQQETTASATEEPAPEKRVQPAPKLVPA